MKQLKLKKKNFSLKKNRLLEALKILNNEILTIEDIIDSIVNHVLIKGKILLCGNGGSAADAQHLAAEFLVRLRPHVDRKPIAAISLAMDTSTITACGNDYSFDKLFSRNLEALSAKNDILIVISTSGNSKNIVHAINTANSLDLHTIGLTGQSGGKLSSICDIAIQVPATEVPRVQELHLPVYHTLCQVVEDTLFP